MADSIPILSDIFGSKPDIAGFQNINLGQEQLNALQEDISAWPKIEQMGNLYQQYMLDSYKSAGFDLSSILGAAHGDISTALGQAGQELRGQIPADVAAQVQRSSAFQNLAAGTAGSPMADANAARNYGLTSLDLINRGASLLDTTGNAAQRWSNIAGQTIMSPAGFVITPAQQAQSTLSNRLIQRQIQQERYNVAAAPNPIAKGLSDLVAYLTASYIGHGPAGQPPAAQSFAGATDTTGTGYGLSSAPGAGGSAYSGPPVSSVTGGAGPVSAGDPNIGIQYGSGYPVQDPALYGGAAATGGTYGYPIGTAGPTGPYTPGTYYDQLGQFSPFQQGTGI